ncbi:MAG: CoxG family protein [Burkholderiaceae bacterium]
MQFQLASSVPRSPQDVWLLLTDIGRIASCIPGCENVQEKEPLASYSAVFKQQIGPFRLQMPADISVVEQREPERLKAIAQGRDKTTGTQVTLALEVDLAPEAGGGCRLAVASDLQIAGRLATLGYPVIKKKVDENFTEFQRRLMAALQDDAAAASTAAPAAGPAGTAPAPAPSETPPASGGRFTDRVKQLFGR